MKAMRTLRIDPDGSVTASDLAPLAAATAERDHLTVVVCAAPFLPNDTIWVGVLDDFGAADLPLNRKGWALYGRSPLYGPVFFGADDDRNIPVDVAAMLRRDLEDWPIPELAAAVVLGPEPPRPDMLAERPTS